MIREQGRALLAARFPAEPARWIAVDRARDARGLFGIYEAVKADYWRAMETGAPVGLRWQRVPGER